MQSLLELVSDELVFFYKQSTNWLVMNLFYPYYSLVSSFCPLPSPYLTLDLVYIPGRLPFQDGCYKEDECEFIGLLPSCICYYTRETYIPWYI